MGFTVIEIFSCEWELLIRSYDNSFESISGSQYIPCQHPKYFMDNVFIGRNNSCLIPKDTVRGN